jgi:hypothetical protein
MSNISLYLDQDNELKFNVAIEGSKPGTPKYRLMLEGKDFSYSFRGQQASSGEVSFMIPALKNVLKEGSYKADLEVVIDDRHFTPLTFDAMFETSVKVTAESISRPTQKKVGVTASIVTASTPNENRIIENASSSASHKKDAPTRQARSADTIGEMNGKKITAEDLRRMIRSGGFNV